MVLMKRKNRVVARGLREGNGGTQVREGAEDLLWNRRNFISGAAGTALVMGLSKTTAFAEATGEPVNLAKVALPLSFMIYQ